MTIPAFYEVEHISRYRYSSPVRGCALSLCLKPMSDDCQELFAFNLTTCPVASITSENDSFGNTKHILHIHQNTDLVEVISRSSLAVHCGIPSTSSWPAGTWDEVRLWKDSFEHWEFLRPSPFVRNSDTLDTFVNEVGIELGANPFESVLRLSDVLHDSFQYVPGMTTVVSPIEHILESRQGVCQDYAHVMITVARGWGIPARYVSGYLYVKSRDHDADPGAASHAWVECLLPSLGWVGFDPTNRCVVDERHIRLGVGRDYQDVAPIRGIFMGGGVSELSVEVRVRKDTALQK